MYVLIIWSGLVLAIVVLFIPETYAPLLLQRKASFLNRSDDSQQYVGPLDTTDRTVLQTLRQSCSRPFKLLLQEYMVTCLCMLTAVLLGVQYLLFGAFAYSYRKVYGFTQSEIGLTFLGIGVGAVLGAAMAPIFRKIWLEQIAKNKGVSEPEFRLPPAAFGAMLLPISLFVHSMCSVQSSDQDCMLTTSQTLVRLDVPL